MKKLLTIIILIILIFNSNQAYAVSDNEYTIKNTFFVNNIEIDNISENNKNKTNFWWMSILVPGLGQILMGDFWRGIKYFIIIDLVTIFLIYFYRTIYPENPLGDRPMADISIITRPIEIYTIIYLIIIYILNINDAYLFHLENKENNFYIGRNGISYNLIKF